MDDEEIFEEYKSTDGSEIENNNHSNNNSNNNSDFDRKSRKLIVRPLLVASETIKNLLLSNN